MNDQLRIQPLDIQPSHRTPRRRRSSLLDRWIQDQQNLTPASADSPANSESVPSIGTKCNPYLAYPQMSRYSTHSEVGTLHSYDVIDHDDIPDQPVHLDPEPPPPSSWTRPSTRLQGSPSLRNFHVPFRSNSPSPAPSMVPTSPTSSHNPSRISLFSRASMGTPTKQSHPASLSTFNFHGRSSSHGNSIVAGSVTGSNWKWRSSVLGHFSTSPVKPSSNLNKRHAPSRPSTSSTNTYRSATPSTTTEGEAPFTPHKLSFVNSFRSRTSPVFNSGSTASSPSLISPSMSASVDRIESSPGSAFAWKGLAHKASTVRVPFTPKAKSRLAMSVSNNEEDVEAQPDPTVPYVAYASNNRVSLSSLASSTRNRKKKKLVISGIASTDKRKFDGAKRWCESFGQVSEITRMPNGDLHVNFRDAEVAETVCRIRAKVYIAGVGSVYLSWYVGKKR